MAETRNFALRDEKGNEIGVFTGKQPRQAALKAANRGITDIRLRERSTKRVHIFQGERSPGGKTERSACLDAGQDLEAEGEEAGRGKAGRAITLIATPGTAAANILPMVFFPFQLRLQAFFIYP